MQLSCFEVTQPATRGRVRVVRDQLVAWLAPLCLPEEWVAEVVLAVGEAASNAVIHGSPRGERDSFAVRCEAGRQTITITVTDAGRGFVFRGVPALDPRSESEHGRGLGLMAALTDRLTIHHRPGGTRLYMEKRLPVS